MIIAQRFIAGFTLTYRVPEGRLSGTFNRPSGTSLRDPLFPAMNRKALSKPSLTGHRNVSTHQLDRLKHGRKGERN